MTLRLERHGYRDLKTRVSHDQSFGAEPTEHESSHRMLGISTSQAFSDSLSIFVLLQDDDVLSIAVTHHVMPRRPDRLVFQPQPIAKANL